VLTGIVGDIDKRKVSASGTASNQHVRHGKWTG
jgi:hypothetical protein